MLSFRIDRSSIAKWIVFTVLGGVCLFLSCGDPIEGFDGFIKPEVEHLLSQDTFKDWVRIDYHINDQPVEGTCNDSLTLRFTKVENKEDTSGLVWIKPLTGCGETSFCSEHPEICDVHDEYCGANQQDCENIEPGFYFAGSWYISDPPIENDEVHRIILKNTNDSLIYHIEFLTSLNLELTVEKEDDSIFEKYIAK